MCDKRQVASGWSGHIATSRPRHMHAQGCARLFGSKQVSDCCSFLFSGFLSNILRSRRGTAAQRAAVSQGPNMHRCRPGLKLIALFSIMISNCPTMSGGVLGAIIAGD